MHAFMDDVIRAPQILTQNEKIKEEKDILYLLIYVKVFV